MANAKHFLPLLGVLLVVRHGRCQCNGTILDVNASTPGRITSTGFPTANPINEQCGWHIVASTGKLLRLELSFATYENVQDYFRMYDGPSDWDPLIFTSAQPLHRGYRITLLTSSNAATIVWRVGGGSFRTGFELFYEGVDIVPAQLYTNGSSVGTVWSSNPAYVQPSGSIRLNDATVDQLRTMWSLTQIAYKSFIVKLRVTIGNTGNGTEGLGISFVGNNSVSYQNTSTSLFGIEWTRFYGLSIFFSPKEQSIYAVNSGTQVNFTAKPDCGAPGTLSVYCHGYSQLVDTFDITISIKNEQSLTIAVCSMYDTTVCESILSPVTLSGPLVTNSNGGLIFGLASYSSAFYSGTVDVSSIVFAVPAIDDCPLGCPTNAYCSGGGNCSCFYGWIGTNCTTPSCPSGCNSGTCVAPYYCACPAGIAGDTCTVSLCQTVNQIVNPNTEYVCTQWNFYYYYKTDCAWNISVPDGHRIRVTLWAEAVNNDTYDWMDFYDGSGPSADKLITRVSYFGTTNPAPDLTLLSTSNYMYIRFVTNPYRFGVGKSSQSCFFYTSVVVDPELSLLDPFDLSKWDLITPPAANSTHDYVQLVPSAATNNGVMWTKNTINDTTFAVNILGEIGSTGTGSVGLGVFFVSNVTMITASAAALSTPYGLSLNNFEGLGVFVEGSSNYVDSVFSTSSTSVVLHTCQSQQFCAWVTVPSSLRQKFRLTIALLQDQVLWVTLCLDTWSPKCLPITQTPFTPPSLFTHTPGPLYFGLGAYNSLSSYDYVNIQRIEYTTDAAACPFDCKYGYCETGYFTKCSCLDYYTQNDCSQLICANTCYNGGYCEIPNGPCICPLGWTGFDCQTASCVTNTSISTTTTGTLRNNNDSSSGNYYNNERCGWIITVQAGFSIRLDFTFGTMETKDVVRIYDGQPTLLEEISASYFSGSLTVVSNTVFIYFYTDSSGVGTGFQIDYTQRALAPMVSGNIQNINYPSGNYYNNETERWILSGPVGKLIHLYLTASDATPFGNAGDSVKIYDGPSSLSPVMQDCSGPAGTYAVVSTSNTVLVTFTTDASLVGTGFLLAFNLKSPGSCTPLKTITNQTNNVIYNANYPADYNNNETCQWIITAPVGQVIWLSYTLRNVFPGDLISTYEGTSAVPSALLGIADQQYTASFVSKTNSVLISFYSNADYIVASGFTIVFRFVTYTPHYSFDNGDFSDWQTYPSPPSLQGNGALRLVNDTANINGAMWAMAPIRLTDFCINITLTIGAVNAGGSNGVAIFFVSNSTVIRTGNWPFGVDYNSFAGLSIRASPSDHSIFASFSATPSATIAHYTYNDGSTVASRTSTGNLNANLHLFITVTNGTYLTIDYSTLQPWLASNNIELSATLVSTILSAPGPLMFGIAASNDATHNYVDIQSVKFYSTYNCSVSCQNNGVCIGQNVCWCQQGWNGSLCEMPICTNGCAHSGVCISPDVCSCSVGWTDLSCGTAICTSTCQNGATCIAPDTCQCVAGWIGAVCSTAICTSPCVNGNCTSPNTCTCSARWTDPTCSTAMCNPSCQNTGMCIQPDVCNCTSSWTGGSCTIPVCNPACGIGGSCTAPNTCTCLVGWNGTICDSPICPNGCAHGGVCISPGVCSCSVGWTDVSCQTAICTSICQNGASCIAPDTCQCVAGWTDPVCSTAICTNPCVNGNCTSPDTCTCSTGWTDPTCSTPMCNPSCQNTGTCVQPDVCNCTSSWTGGSCAIPICNPACGIEGSCTAPNTCTCLVGWNGATCDSPICTNPCMNGGTCSGPDQCLCLLPWGGATCEIDTNNIDLPQLVAMTSAMNDQSLGVNLPGVGVALMYISRNAAKEDDPQQATDTITYIGSLMDRISRITDPSSPATSSQVIMVFAEAMDILMYPFTNYTLKETAVKTPVGMRTYCQVYDEELSEVAEPPPPNAYDKKPSKEQLRNLYSAFLSSLVKMLGHFRQVIASGNNMTFKGDFYSACVFNIRFGDLPRLKLPTPVAIVTYADVNDPFMLFTTPTATCSGITQDTDVLVVISGYIVNVNSVDLPFNMPTVSVNIYCNEQSPLTLNPEFPITVQAISPYPKANLFNYEKIRAQCDVSKLKCDSDNAADLGALATFPVNLTAGDFFFFVQHIPYNYTVYVSFNAPPNSTYYNWFVNKTGDLIQLVQNGAYVSNASYSYDKGYRLQIRIPSITLKQLSKAANIQGPIVMLYAFMKKDLSVIAGLSTWPSSACELKRIPGCQLKIGFAFKSNTQRKRRAVSVPTGSDDGFELQADANESVVVFKSSYFGDYGSDLLITPNTIEFANIFANFTTLVAENSAVLAFMVSSVVFFVFGMVFAHRNDPKDLQKWAFLPLIGNKRYERVNYMLSVHHRNVRNYSLGQQIFLRMIGSIHDTEWRLLDDGERRNFEGKRPANFILSTQVRVGAIEAIELRLSSKTRTDAVGGRFSIHIDRVAIIDMEQGTKFIFVTKSTLEIGDAIRVTAASEDELKGYLYLVTGHSRMSFTDIHPWMSVMQRPLASNWTRAERLGCVVSALFLAMMVNAMFYDKSATAPDVAVKVGHIFTITWFTLWTSFVGCLIAIPPTAIIGIIFKKVKRRSAEKSEWTTILNAKVKEINDDKTKKKPLQLPYYCVIIAWILVALSVLISAFVVIMYSLSWGRAKSLQWLTGMIISIVQDIMLIQPVKVIVMSILSATLHNLPIDGMELGKLTYNRTNNRRKTELFFRARGVIVGLLHHVIYLLIFAAAIGTFTNRFAFLQIESLRPAIEVPDVEKVFGTVTDPAVIYNWLLQNLIPNFLTGNQVEFGGQYATAKAMYAIQNPNVAILGPIRLRQQRVLTGKCSLQTGKFIRALTNLVQCQEPFENGLQIATSSEQRSFNGSWSSIAFIDINSVSSDVAPWVYRSTDGIPHTGLERTYFNSGYYIDLPRKKSAATAAIYALIQNRWLDNATTVLFVDFNLFNAQTNLFIPVRVVFEALSAGGMSYQVYMFPLQLYQYSGAGSALIYAVQLLWVIALVSHLVELIRYIKKHGFPEFKANGWNWLNLCQCLLGLGVVAIFASRIYFVITSLNKIKNMRTTFINLDLLVHWEDVMFCVFGIQFFMAMILFFRHLSINKHWAVLLRTFSVGKMDFISYGVVFSGATIIFAGIANLIMGSSSWNFSSYARAVLTFIQGLLGTVNFSSVSGNHFFLFIAMFYNAVVIFFGGFIFSALIIAAHDEVIASIARQATWDIELDEYMHESIKSILSFKKKTKKWPDHVTPLSELSATTTPKDVTRFSENLVTGNRPCSEFERTTGRLANFVENTIDLNLGEEADKRYRCELVWLANMMEYFISEHRLALLFRKKAKTQRISLSSKAVPSKSPIRRILSNNSVAPSNMKRDMPVDHVRNLYFDPSGINEQLEVEKLEPVKLEVINKWSEYLNQEDKWSEYLNQDAGLAPSLPFKLNRDNKHEKSKGGAKANTNTNVIKQDDGYEFSASLPAFNSNRSQALQQRKGNLRK